MPAVTLTYDDALSSQLATAAPSLKTHGLKATFFVTDVRSNPAPWSALLADGHELASHTFKHPCPRVNTWVTPGNANEDYDEARMGTELDESVAMLEMLGQKPPFTFAYPCGITWLGEDQRSYIPLVEERFTASRGTSPGQIQEGVNLYNVPATFSTGTGEALIALAEQAKSQGTWVVYGFHGIGADSNVIPAESHEALLVYLEEQRDSIYVATFGELAACFTP
jgi:peptidoglycan/xylan/chitin deacetylase (PgdA/CDA1 family)